LQADIDDTERLQGRVNEAAGPELTGVVPAGLIMVAAPLTAFLVVGALTFATTSDDPLITLRYASNLLHHGQPVFNLGERVEGYTSPLHLLIATVVLLLPGGVALFKLKLVSMLFAAGTVWQTSRLAWTIGLPRWAQLAAVVALAGSWNFMLSASNGLETSLVAFLVTGTAVSLANAASTQRWRNPAVWAACLALTRPDALLVIVLLALVNVVRNRAVPWWRRVYWLAGPAVTLAILLVFRLVYYGGLLPNTYFAKQLGVWPSAVRGVLYLLYSEPLGGLGLGLVVLVLEAWLISVAGRRYLRARPGMAYPMAVVVAQVMFIFASGGDWMKGGRFLVPAIPAATVLAFSGMDALLTAARSNDKRSRARRGLIAATLVALFIAPVDGTYFAPAWRLSSGLGDRALIAHGNYVLSPIWGGAVSLADCLKPGQSVAFSEVGLFGYEHLGLRVIDTRGLTSEEIAQGAPSADKHPFGVEDPHWYLASSSVGRILVSRRPDLIISIDDAADNWPSSHIFGGLYRRVALIPEPRPNHTMLVYLRRGLACSPSPSA
jgi:hypothetical protein